MNARIEAETAQAVALGRELIAHGRWHPAALVWAACALLRPSEPEPCAMEVLALREAGLFDDALRAGDRGIRTFPDAERIYVERALIFFALRRWGDAFAAFSQIRKTFPDSVDGYLRGSAAARELGRIDDALKIIRCGVAVLPESLPLLEARAELEELYGDWSEAARSWETIQRQVQDARSGENAARCWSRGGHAERAEVILSVGMARFEEDLGLLAEAARVATRQADWEVVRERWSRLAEFDARYRTEAASRIADATRFLELRRRITRDHRLAAAVGGEADRSWTERLRDATWTLICEGQPVLGRGIRLTEVGEIWNFCGSYRSWDARQGQLCLLDDTGSVAVRFSMVEHRDDGSISLSGRSLRHLSETITITLEEEALPLAELMGAFESLGDNCEFGLVQRYYGSEPMGLYRFNYASFQSLTAAFDEDFRGLDVPGCNEVAADAPGGELVGTMSRYGFRYHTFRRDDGATDIAKLTASELERLQFLRDKLQDQLATGGKIFVRKGQETLAEVVALSERLRRDADNWILWVRECDRDHPAASVELYRRGIILGYVEAFAPYDAAGKINPDAWAKICSKAYRIVHQRG